MKPSRFSAFARTALGVSSLITLNFGPVFAADIYWDRSVNPGTWGVASNWSTANNAPTPDPGTPPGSGDVAVFTTSGTPTFVAQTVNLGADQAVLGIRTASQTILTTLLGGGTAQTLSIGTSGIVHAAGGLTIGSATAGQEVNISLQGSQTWNSGTAGTGAAAIVVNNGVSIGAGGNQTLTLAGINTGTLINGTISDGAGVLGITKTGTGLWTLTGTANTYTGATSVNAGTLRLTNAGAANAANVTIAGGATLALRVGGTGAFTTAQFDTFRSLVTYSAATSILALDTNNGSIDYGTSLTGNNFTFGKTGGNGLTLTGSNSGFTGATVVNEGSLIFANTAARTGGTVSVASGAVLAGIGGGAGFTSAQLDALRTSTTFAAGSSFGISTLNGDFDYTSSFGGAIGFTKNAVNTLILSGSNTYTGVTNITNGIVSISELGNGGAASSIGAATNAATNLLLSSARLRYVGEATTTDRLFSFSGTSTIDSSGTGALVFSNIGAIVNAGNAGARTLVLTGTNTDANTIAGVITNSGTGTNVTNITKNGSGNWVLSGTNTYSGTTRINGGSLTFDYSAKGNTSDALGAGLVVGQAGTYIFKGKTTGTTTDTISTLQVGENNTGAVSVVLNSNGGSGVNLAVTTLQGSTSTQHHDLFDLSSNAANSITVGALATTLGTVNGVLMNNVATVGNGRASLIVRDSTGYGFATLSGTTTGNLQKLATFTAGSNTMTDATANYSLTAGTYSPTANVAFNTLTFDSSAGAVNLVLGSSSALAAGASGKATLFTGTNNVTISGGPATTAASPLWFHNYLESSASLNIASSLGTGQTVLFGGSGFTNYSGVGHGNNFVLNGGLFRTNTDQTLGTATSFRINTGGVLEIGADLNGAATAGDFTNSIGTANGNISFYGDAGLSAYTATPGGVRVVDFLSSAVSQVLTWGSGSFLTNVDNTTDGDYTLKLSSNLSNATLDLKNSINLNGRSRTIDVANGSAGEDAILSGVISGSIATGITKTGAGTLRLAAENTYFGGTKVVGGRLILGGSVNSTTSLEIRNATVELGAAQRVNDLASINMVNAQLNTNGFSETMGDLTVTGINTLDLGNAASIVRFAGSADNLWTGTFSIANWNGSLTGGGTDQVYFGSDTTGLTGAQLASIFFQNPNGVTGTFGASYLATGEVVPLIPEPSVLLLGAFATLGAALRRRRPDA